MDEVLVVSFITAGGKALVLVSGAGVKRVESEVVSVVVSVEVDSEPQETRKRLNMPEARRIFFIVFFLVGQGKKKSGKPCYLSD